MPIITQEEIQKSEIKALTWKQPFATLMLYGKQETRAWNTKVRGLVLICSSVKNYVSEEVFDIAGATQYNRIHARLQTGRFKVINGFAIGIGRLADSQNMQECAFSLEELEEKTFVSYRSHLWVHFYEDVRPIKPFEWKGGQRWRNVTPEQKSKIILL